jgi:hypothetical protein
MFDPKSVAQAYLETWNEPNEEQRRSLLNKHWTKNATYVDPLMHGDGADQIANLVRAVHQRFPGYRFQQLGTPDGHGDYVRLSWTLGLAGSEPPIEGSDVMILQDGRISQVIGFIDRAPAMA